MAKPNKKKAAAKKVPVKAVKKPAVKTKAPNKKKGPSAKVNPPKFTKEVAQGTDVIPLPEQGDDSDFSEDVKYRKLMFSVAAQHKDATLQLVLYLKALFEVMNLQAGTVIQTMQGAVVDGGIHNQLAVDHQAALDRLQQLEAHIGGITNQYNQLHQQYMVLYNQVNGGNLNVPR